MRTEKRLQCFDQLLGKSTTFLLPFDQLITAVRTVATTTSAAIQSKTLAKQRLVMHNHTTTVSSAITNYGLCTPLLFSTATVAVGDSRSRML